MSRTVKADAVSKCDEVCRMTNRRRTRTLIPGETLHVPEHLFMKIHIEALQKFNSWGVTPWHRCTRSFVLTKSFVKLHGPWRSLSIVSMHQLRFCYFRDLDWHPVRALLLCAWFFVCFFSVLDPLFLLCVLVYEGFLIKYVAAPGACFFASCWQKWTRFGLQESTIDFIGHAVALQWTWGRDTKT